MATSVPTATATTSSTSSTAQSTTTTVVPKVLPKSAWMLDKDAVLCSNCQQPFGGLRRRHHCRFCGRVFCERCSPNKVIGQRACHRCRDKHSGPDLGPTLDGPRAVVLYSNERATEPEVEVFPGQIVALRLWIDKDWVLCTKPHGESGILPITYLQIIHPLPPTESLLPNMKL